MFYQGRRLSEPATGPVACRS